MFTITPYESTFTGGVRVATGDVNGDGIPDIIAAPGAGRTPEIRIYNGLDGSFLQSFLAYESSLWDGVLISAGDVAGSCGLDIVTTPSPGRGKAEVRVWENQPGGFVMSDHFLPFGPNFYGGASNAIADFNGDGVGDIAVGALHGLAHVAVFGGAIPAGASELARFLAFGSDFFGGVHLAVGNVIGSDKPDLIVSAGENAWASQYSSRVHIYNGANLAYTPNVYDAPDFTFTAFSAESEYPRASTRVVAKDYDLGGAIDELFVSQGPAGRSHQVKVFLPASGALVDSIFESDSLFDHGIFVG